MLTFQQFRAECSKANKGEPCHPDVQKAWDNAKGKYIERQAAAWNAYNPK